MHVHLFAHHAPATNGAPQTVAVGFASLVFFTFLFPFAEISSGGTMAPGLLVHLLKTDAGFNVFVLAVMLAPPIGVAVAMAAHSAWRIVSMLVALAAIAMILLSLLTLSRGIPSATHGWETVSPGLGSYILLIGYSILAVSTGITAFRARHEDQSPWP